MTKGHLLYNVGNWIKYPVNYTGLPQDEHHVKLREHANKCIHKIAKPNQVQLFWV